MASYRTRTRTYSGTAAAATPTAITEINPLRIWAAIECDLTTAVPVLVTISDRADASAAVSFQLQPGERVVFSQAASDMPWTGTIFVEGVGGGAVYRGGEVYLERIGD